MAINYPGTFEVRFIYQTNEPAGTNEHEARFSCEMDVEASPGDPFTDWFPIQKDGGTSTHLKDHVDNLHALLRPLWNTTTDLVAAELWEYAPGTFDSIFRSALSIGLTGGSASATVAQSQSIISLRSSLGGIMKVDLRGTIFAAAVSQSFPTAVTAVNTLASYLIGASSIWVARDGGYAVAPLRFLPGSNERAFKKVFRPS